MTDKILALSTAANVEEARRIARGLVDAGLAACVNVVPGITSVYRWKGNVEESAEVLLIIKTRQDLSAAVSAGLRELHSYELPEFITLPLTGGLPQYLQWIEDETRVPGQGPDSL